MIQIDERNKRALKALGVAVGIFSVVFAVIWFWPQPSPENPGAAGTVPQAEKRLKSLRRLVAAVPAREEIDRRFGTELAKREKGLINAETPAQAQAQLLQIVRRVAQSQSPALPVNGSEFSPVKQFGNAYGEVTVTISAECGIEQILNFMADLSNQPELIATSSLQFGQAHPKKKTLPVRMTISGLVPKRLAPERKNEVSF
jgi:hypothetical protein